MSNEDAISNNDDNNDGPCLSLFQCCHPKAEVDCWSAFKNFVLHQNDSVNPVAKEESGPQVGLNTTATTAQESTSSQSDTTTTTTEKPVKQRSTERQAAPSLTAAEKHRLSKILAVLAQQDTTEDATDPVPTTGQTTEEKKESSEACKQPSSSFLLQLATAASTVALEAKSNNQAQGNDNDEPAVFDPNDDNPQAMIQRLLQEASRQEALQQVQKQHLDRVAILVQDLSLPKLVRPLETALEKNSDLAGSDNNHFSLLSVLVGRCAPSTTLEFLWNALDSGDTKSSTENDKPMVYSLMELCFHLALAHAFLTCSDDDKKQSQLQKGLQQQSINDKKDPAIQTMHQSFLSFLDKQQQQQLRPEESHKLLQDHFLKWHDRHVPSMLSTLSVCMREILFPSLSNDNDVKESSLLQNDGWTIPSLDRDEGSDNLLFSSSSSSAALSSWQFIMACTMPPRQHEKVGSVWHRLYSTHSEGFSLSTLEHSLTGYHGPTLLLVEALDKDSQTNQTFGAFASQPWIKQDGPDFYGDCDSFLFQLEPKFKVARAETEQQHTLPNYQYFYLDNSNVPTTLKRAKDDKKQHESGIGFGGSRRRPRFFLAASLDHCYLGGSDATFQDNHDDQSNTMIHPFWDLHSLEVWGLGGDAAMKSLQRHRSMEDAQLQKARQVDKAAFLNDFRSGLLESKMFGFHEDIRNRDGGCMLDCHDEEEDE